MLNAWYVIQLTSVGRSGPDQEASACAPLASDVARWEMTAAKCVASRLGAKESR